MCTDPVAGLDAGNLQVEMIAEQLPSVHECLAQYPYSSYQYYTKRYGEEFLTDIWLRYGFPRYLESMLEPGD